MDFSRIESIIDTNEWIFFGEKPFECSGLTELDIEYYERTRLLPDLCKDCYKSLIFWNEFYCEENVSNFIIMIESLNEEEGLGKFNRDVAVFYFREKMAMLNFNKQLENKMREFQVNGKIQWRMAYREYQDHSPFLWKNAKIFTPDRRK